MKTLKCDWCLEEFRRRKVNKGYKNRFCCQDCKNAFYSRQNSDQYTIFRRCLKKVRERSAEKKWKTDLTLADLAAIFNGQGGLCPYTGKPMSTVYNRNPNQCSLDRKDSNKPYTKDNVEFVSLIAQYAKNVFTREDVVRFAEDVVFNNRRISNEREYLDSAGGAFPESRPQSPAA